MRYSTDAALKRRLEGSFIFLMVLFFALALRLVWIQGVRHDHYEQKAQLMHDRVIALEPARGEITDSRGRAIVTNVEAMTLGCNPRVVPNKEAVAAKLAATFGGPVERYL